MKRLMWQRDGTPRPVQLWKAAADQIAARLKKYRSFAQPNERYWMEAA